VCGGCHKEIILPTIKEVFGNILVETLKLKKYLSVGVCGLIKNTKYDYLNHKFEVLFQLKTLYLFFQKVPH